MQTGTRGKQLAWSISAPPKDHEPADLVSINFFLTQIKNGKLTSCDLCGGGGRGGCYKSQVQQRTSVQCTLAVLHVKQDATCSASGWQGKQWVGEQQVIKEFIKFKLN